MGPESLALMIPVLALSIPIVAIIANAATKKYKYNGNPDQTEKIAALEQRIQELEASLDQVNGNVDQLEERQNFITRLLEDKH